MNPQEGPGLSPTRPASNYQRTPRVDLSEIIAATDLVELVSEWAGPSRQSGGKFLYSCPSPDHPDRNPSFTVEKDRSGRWRWKCWSQCNASGDALDFVVWITGESKSEARLRLGRRAGLLGKRTFIPTARNSERFLSKESPRPYRSPKVLNAKEGQAILAKYLNWRGWSEDAVEQFGLETVLDRRGRYRIRHPFFRPEKDGSLSVPYWQDRGRTKDDGPKWLSPANTLPIPHNLPSLAVSNLRGVLFVEGPADAISGTLALGERTDLAVIGIPGIGAWKKEWSIAASDLPVAIWRDSDPAGLVLVEHLRSSFPDLQVLEGTEKDLSDTFREDGAAVVRERILEVFPSEHARPMSEEEWLDLAVEIFPGSKLVHVREDRHE